MDHYDATISFLINFIILYLAYSFKDQLFHFKEALSYSKRVIIDVALSLLNILFIHNQFIIARLALSFRVYLFIPNVSWLFSFCMEVSLFSLLIAPSVWVSGSVCPWAYGMEVLCPCPCPCLTLSGQSGGCGRFRVHSLIICFLFLKLTRFTHLERN